METSGAANREVVLLQKARFARFVCCRHFAQHLLLAKQTLGVGKAQHPKTRPAHLIFTVQGVEAKTLLTSLIHFAACFTVSLCTFIYCILYIFYILYIDY